MRGWGLVVVLLAAGAVVGLLLKELPPGVIVVLAVAGSGYGASRYSQRKKADARTVESRALGFDLAAADSLGALLALPLQLLARGGETGTVGGVMQGTWNGLQVRLFEFGYRSEDEGHPDRRWSCALAELDVECKPVVIEPTTFFTPPGERGSVPQVDLDLGTLDETLAIRTNHPQYARSLMAEEMQSFLQELDGEVAFEVSGRMLLGYAPVRVRDSLDLLQAVAGFARLIPHEPVRQAAPSGS